MQNKPVNLYLLFSGNGRGSSLSCEIGTYPGKIKVNIGIMVLLPSLFLLFGKFINWSFLLSDTPPASQL